MLRVLYVMNPSVDQLLDLLLDGDPVAWEISRTPDGLRIVGRMQNGETRLLAIVPVKPPEIDQDPCR
jgi:hypothetical protein